MPTSDHVSGGKKPPSDSSRRALRTIAVFEATKGVAALAMLAGVIDLMHHDVRHLALELIGHFGWNPQAHYSEIILHYANMLPGANMQQLVLLVFAYASIRLVEAYGLWNDQAWSEWLGALSGGIYIPLELSHLVHRPSAINVVVLASNIFLVGFLVRRLRQRVQHADPR